MKYYKLGTKASMFYDPRSGLKVTKRVPGKLMGSDNPFIRDCAAKGHIIEIDKDKYDEMMAAHDVMVTKNNQETQDKANLRRKIRNGAPLPASTEEEEEEEEVEEEEEDDEEPAEDSAEDLVIKILKNENVPSELKSKKKLRKKSVEELKALLSQYPD